MRDSRSIMQSIDCYALWKKTMSLLAFHGRTRYTFQVVLDHLLTQSNMSVRTIDINLFTLKWKTQIFKIEKEKSGEWNLSKRGRTSSFFTFTCLARKWRDEEEQRERERERRSISLSFSPSSTRGRRRRDSTAEQQLVRKNFSMKNKAEKNYLQRMESGVRG